MPPVLQGFLGFELTLSHCSIISMLFSISQCIVSKKSVTPLLEQNHKEWVFTSAWFIRCHTHVWTTWKTCKLPFQCIQNVMFQLQLPTCRKLSSPWEYRVNLEIIIKKHTMNLDKCSLHICVKAWDLFDLFPFLHNLGSEANSQGRERDKTQRFKNC